VALLSDVSCLITIADTMTSNREGRVRDIRLPFEPNWTGLSG